MEKEALAQCSVFAGSFSLEAAEAVLALRPTSDGGAPPSVLDALQSLHDKSLVRAFDPRGPALERRYGLLEPARVRRGRLEELGGTAAAVERHAAFFLDLAGPGARFFRARPTSLASRSRSTTSLAVCARASPAGRSCPPTPTPRCAGSCSSSPCS